MTLVHSPVRGAVRLPTRAALGGLVPGLPSLGASIDPVSVSETAGTATGTVTRPADLTDGILTVTLSSSDTSEATVPATVDIPDGQASVTFTITILNENLEDGDQVSTISVSAEGYSGASANITVTDVGVAVSPLAAIQTAYQAGDFAAYWGIQDGYYFQATNSAINGPSGPSAQSDAAIVPDKAAFDGDETVVDHVSRLSLTGTADALPGFIGYQNTGTYEPRFVGNQSPKYLQQGNSDENLSIRSNTNYMTGATAHTIVLAIRTTDDDFFTIGDSDAIRYAGRVRNAGSAADSFAGDPSYRVDGADVVGDLANALFGAGVSDGTWSILTIQNLDLSGWTGDFVVGGRVITGANGFNMDGDIAYVAIFPDDTTTRDLAEAEAAALVGITLP